MDLQVNLHHKLYVLGALTNAYRSASPFASGLASAASPLASITALKEKHLCCNQKQGMLPSKHSWLKVGFHFSIYIYIYLYFIFSFFLYLFIHTRSKARACARAFPSSWGALPPNPPTFCLIPWCEYMALENFQNSFQVMILI